MAEIKLDDLKPNSNKYKKEQAAKAEERRHEAIVTKDDLVNAGKPSLGKKFSDLFIAEDIRSVKRYVVREVLVPSLIGMFVDAVTNGVEMMFGVSPTRRSIGKGGNSSAYSTYFKSGNRNDRRDDFIDRDSWNDYRDIKFVAKDKAEDVLRELQYDCIPEEEGGYGQTTLASLYELMGMKHTPQDRNWGWTDLRGIRIYRIVGGGWKIDLPKPEYLGER